MRILMVFIFIILLNLVINYHGGIAFEAEAADKDVSPVFAAPDKNTQPDASSVQEIQKMKEKHPEWFSSPSSSTTAATTATTETKAEEGKTPSLSDVGIGGGGGLIPYDVKDEEIVELRKRAKQIQKLMEENDAVEPKFRSVVERFGKAPAIHLSLGYHTILHLPYDIEGDKVAVGDKSIFTFELHGRDLMIFPVKPFKRTNLTLFDRTGKAHQFLLVEDSIAGSVDFFVKILNAKDAPSLFDTVLQAAVSEKTKMLDGSDAEIAHISPRNGKHEDVVRRKIELSKPKMNAWLLNGEYVPLNPMTEYLSIDNHETFVMSPSPKIKMRRVYDSENITLE